MDCPFDHPPAERVFYEDDLVRCLWDAFPVSDGHALVITRRHVATWFDATPDELAAVLHAVERAKQEIERTRRPDGYNIGTTAGEAAGQTVPHFHGHVL
ncbi:MAG: HIT family protein, partial [Gammaproteobacteria bacterium]